MPVCPKCQQEYDDGFKDCADCLVPLVSAAAYDDKKDEEEALQFAVFRGQNEDVLDLMQRAVAVHQIPTECTDEIPTLGLKGHLLIVPAQLAEKAAQILDSGVRDLMGEGEGKDRTYRFYRPGEEEEIRDPELLRAPLWNLMERGDEIIDELIEIVARGDQTARQRAAYVLSSLGEEGVLALIKLLKVAIEKEQHDVAITLIRVIRKEVDSGFGWEEICPYLTASKISKILALQALSALGNMDAFSAVIPLLEDEDSEVRDEADNTLCTLSDEDLGFDSQAPVEERKETIKKWQEWWSRRKDG